MPVGCWIAHFEDLFRNKGGPHKSVTTQTYIIFSVTLHVLFQILVLLVMNEYHIKKCQHIISCAFKDITIPLLEWTALPIFPAVICMNMK